MYVCVYVCITYTHTYTYIWGGEKQRERDRDLFQKVGLPNNELSKLKCVWLAHRLETQTVDTMDLRQNFFFLKETSVLLSCHINLTIARTNQLVCDNTTVVM